MPPPNPPRPTLNAIAQILETDPATETTEERTTRHLRICQELIERGMRLARRAADRAEQDMEASDPSPMPGSSAAALEQAEARARLRTNYGVVFTRLSRAVRQTIALQAHIASGRPFARTNTPPDRDPDRERPRTPAARPPNPTTLRLDAADPPDWIIPTGPDGLIAVEALLQTIRANLPATPQDAEPAPHNDTGSATVGWAARSPPKRE